MKNKILNIFIIGIFVSLYFLVATISMINSVEFFDISHNRYMSWTLALGFELGAAASLAAILILEKTNKVMVWGLFILLTSFQMMANSYHAYVNLENYIPWIELFGLIEEDQLTQKRILSILSGAILPVVALGFIKSLTDYIKPNQESVDKPVEEENLFDLLNDEDEPSLSDLNKFYEYPLNSEKEEKEPKMIDDWLNKYGDPKITEKILKESEKIEEVNESETLAKTEEVKENKVPVKLEEDKKKVNPVKLKDASKKNVLPSANAKDKKDEHIKIDNGPSKRQLKTNHPRVTETYKP